jgi:transketolase
MNLTNKLRKLIIEAAFFAKHGHIPSALSIVESVIAIHEIKKDGDIFILSKGHGCLAYYAYLCHIGEITKEELFNFGKKNSKLGGHPDRNKIKSVYASTGSLGHGLPIAVGAALANSLNKKFNKVYCLIGDGESNEGSIWESLSVAKNLNLKNLVCIVDNNNSQIRSLPAINLTEKFKAFGWNTFEIDGHDIELIKNTLNTNSEVPIAIIANTIKGKGIKDIEKNIFGWHHRAPSEIELNNFLKELNEN